jgi:phosphatidylserine decarboxylase
MFIFWQRIIWKHGLSRLLGWFAHCRCTFFKKWAIRHFIRHFKVDLSESLITDIDQFPSFNDFFVRRLKSQARPLPQDQGAIACPADGVISELGKILDGRLLQAKGRYYTLDDLLGGDMEMSRYFNGGEFFTVYLAPKDYHRVHIPVSGTLKRMIHVPGQLFSVNTESVQGIPRLFARNERVICLFATAAGPMAVIFVGALLIGSVVTAWHGEVMPSRGEKPVNKIYQDSSISFQKGDEIGYFQWGSTVIVLFGPDYARWQESLQPGNSVKMGQEIGAALSHSVDLTSIPGEREDLFDMTRRGS